jgi:hypothetical protein
MPHRLKKYHILVWTTALLFSLALALRKTEYGLWGVDASLDSSICWIDSDPDEFNADDDADDDQIVSPVINYRPFVYFYIPVIVFYSYILYVMICAKRILSRGIHTSFLHRIHTLQISRFMLTVFLGYWISQACCYFTSDLIHSKYPQVASFLYQFLLFGMSAKGFPCLLVYLILMKSENRLLRIADEQDRQRSTTQTTVGGIERGTSIDTNIEMNSQDRQSTSNPLAPPPHQSEEDLYPSYPSASASSTLPSTSAAASGAASLGDADTLLFDVNTTLQNQVFVYITLGMKILAKRLTPEPKELITIRFRVPQNFIVPSDDLKVITSGSAHNLQMLVQCDHDQILSNIVQANSELSDFINGPSVSSPSALSPSLPAPLSPYPSPESLSSPPPLPKSSSSRDLSDPAIRVGSSDFDIEELENQNENARVSVTSPHRSAKFSFHNSVMLKSGGDVQISLCGTPFLLPSLACLLFPSLLASPPAPAFRRHRHFNLSIPPVGSSPPSLPFPPHCPSPTAPLQIVITPSRTQ